MDKSMLDLYSDYLLSSFGQTPATRLSNILQGAISHDRITRSLSENIPKSKDLWHMVKRYVRETESVDGRSEEHTSELQSHHDLVCRLLLEKKKRIQSSSTY